MLHERIPGAPPTTTLYGGRPDDPAAPLAGVIVVHDRRAYAAAALEGSIGFGRGFIEGWWSSDDPMTVVRVLIRNMSPIDAFRNRLQRVWGPVTDRIRRRRWGDTRQRNRDDIAAHYDLGNDFFQLFLDETMTYSCAVFPSASTSLADASRHKYDLLIDKLGLTAEHHLLEIGTGWGGLAIRAVERTGCRVTTATISAEQLREARSRIAAASVDDRVTLLDEDWRDVSGVHDRVISIEMIEAVDWRDYDDYFATIERCLAPGGLVAMQAICAPDERWGRAKNKRDFIKHFVFPNGCLASVGAIRDSVARATSMQVVDIEDFGSHYAETLMRWRQRFVSRIDDAKALGLDARFCRLWEFYLSSCEAAFRERYCTVAQIMIAGGGSPLHPRTGLAS
jgi:cyclopropane-fatty-acyl-phospholipid synthase